MYQTQSDAPKCPAARRFSIHLLLLLIPLAACAQNQTLAGDNLSEVQRNTLAFSIFGAEVEVVREYLDQGLDPNFEIEDISMLVRAINSSGRNLGDPIQVIELLLERGADPNHESGEGYLPLYEAIFSRQLEVVERILDAGGDPNKTSERYDAPVWVAALGLKTGTELVKLLVGAGLDIESRQPSTMDTLLLQAVKLRNVELVSFLLHRCADTTIKNKYGRTAVDEAKRHPVILEMVNKHYCGAREAA